MKKVVIIFLLSFYAAMATAAEMVSFPGQDLRQTASPTFVDLILSGANISSASTINIKPSGDTDDYFTFSVVSNRPTIGIIGDTTIDLTSDGTSVAFRYLEDATHFGFWSWTNATDIFAITSTHNMELEATSGTMDIRSFTGLTFKPSNDLDDYLSVTTVANVPTIQAVGGTIIDFASNSFTGLNNVTATGLYDGADITLSGGITLGTGASGGSTLTFHSAGTDPVFSTNTNGDVFLASTSLCLSGGILVFTLPGDDVTFSGTGGRIGIDGNFSVNDTKSVMYGDSQDAEIKFDASDLIINSLNITANDELHFTNFDKYDFDNQVSVKGLIQNTAADKTANYQVLSTDDVISMDATSNTVTATLEAAPATGRVITVSCFNDTFTADIDFNGKNFYGSATNEELFEQELLTLQYNGTEWRLGG